jgi:hypothetical protein
MRALVGDSTNRTKDVSVTARDALHVEGGTRTSPTRDVATEIAWRLIAEAPEEAIRVTECLESSLTSDRSAERNKTPLLTCRAASLAACGHLDRAIATLDQAARLSSDP